MSTTQPQKNLVNIFRTAIGGPRERIWFFIKIDFKIQSHFKRHLITSCVLKSLRHFYFLQCRQRQAINELKLTKFFKPHLVWFPWFHRSPDSIDSEHSRSSNKHKKKKSHHSSHRKQESHNSSSKTDSRDRRERDSRTNSSSHHRHHHKSSKSSKSRASRERDADGESRYVPIYSWAE